ncbi:hypothetical protein D3C84_1311130 [compost metagenome]
MAGQRQALLQDLVELIFAFGVRISRVQFLILLGDAAAQRFDSLAAAQGGYGVDALVVEHQAADSVP